MKPTLSSAIAPLQPGDQISVFSIEHAHGICAWEAKHQNKTITLRVTKGRKSVDITYTPEQAQAYYEQAAINIQRQQRQQRRDQQLRNCATTTRQASIHQELETTNPTMTFEQEQADLNTRRLLSAAITLLRNAINNSTQAEHDPTCSHHIERAIAQLEQAGLLINKQPSPST